MKPTLVSRNLWCLNALLLTQLILLPASPLFSQTTDGFIADANDTVSAISVQLDGRIIVAGNFISLAGQPRAHIGRLYPDGTLDAGFNPTADDSIWCVIVQPDGRILVAGDFRNLGGRPCQFLARLRPDGSRDASFNASLDGYPSSLTLQPDGKILVCGSFGTVNGQPRGNLARLNSDGSLDTIFNPGADARVDMLILQPDGKIVVSGYFTSLAGQPRSGLGRLNPNGSLDPDYNPGITGFLQSSALQADGRLLVGGSFTFLGGQPRDNIGRLNADGTLDLSFNPGANSGVYAIAVQANGNILVGGNFDTLAGQSCSRIGRLTPDGHIDTSFTSSVDGAPDMLVIQPDGGIFVGGYFSMLGGQNRRCLGRLINNGAAPATLSLQDGSVTWLRGGCAGELSRAEFDASTNGATWSSLGHPERIPGGWQVAGAALPADATIRARGFLTAGYDNSSSWLIQSGLGPVAISTQPVSRTNVEHTLAEFSVIASGSPPLNYQWLKNGAPLDESASLSGTHSANLQLTNVLATDAGAYSVVVSNDYRSLTSQVATLTVNLQVIADWLNPGANNDVRAFAIQPDSKILIGGSFTSFAGVPRNYMVRLNLDGSVESAFDPAPNSVVQCIALQPGGKILVGGIFNSLGGQPRGSLGRLNPDGSLDTAFNPGTDGSEVDCILVQRDGKILVAGAFTTLGGQPHQGLGRLNPDGTVDGSFNVNIDYGVVFCIAEQTDGKLLVGGNFGNLGGSPCSNLGRLNRDGSIDSSFAPGPNQLVSCIVLQPDGKILIGGEFSLIGGTVQVGLARLDSKGTLDPNFVEQVGIGVRSIALQADGRIWVAGNGMFMRLLPDGGQDPTYVPDANGGVIGLALQPDGSLLVGGNFDFIGGQPRKHFARLFHAGQSIESLSFDNSTVSWLRTGTAPELSRTTFEANTNETDWVWLGEGTRVPGGWNITGLSLPANVRIRARGLVSGGIWNGSSWYDEQGFGPLSLLSQPMSRTNNAGTTAVFVVQASGTPPLSYQWFKDGVPLTETTDLLGTQAPVLYFCSVWGADGGGYSVVVSNLSGAITSLVANLIVVDPLIVTQAVSVTTNAGNAVALEVSAFGTQPLSFQWWKGVTPLADTGNLSGAQTSRLVISNASGFDTGQYQVVVTNAYGVATGAVANVSITDPFFRSQPSSQLVTNGQTATFAVSPGGTAPFSFQWRKDGVALPGATDNSFIVTNAQWANGGNYNVVISNQFGSATSGQAALSFRAGLETFDPAPGGYVYALAVQPDGATLIGGSFTSLAGSPRSNLGRMNASGTLDPVFNPGPNGAVNCIVLQADGSLLVGGGFGIIGGQSHSYIAKLYNDGRAFGGFKTSADGAVNCLAVQPDGKVLVGGAFNSLNYQWHSRLGRLNPDGTLDTNFNATASGPVNSIALQPDGKILVAGTFTSLGGAARNYIGRLNSDGTLDSSFNPDANGVVNCLTVQPDGAILAGGWFSRVAGWPIYCLTRLHPDGTPDPTFAPQFDNQVFSLALQTDGRVLAGGSFNYIGSQLHSHLVRLDSDGAVDPTFDPGANGNVHALELLADGRILAGGQFTTLASQTRRSVARLSNTYPAAQTLAVNGPVINWTRTAACPEVWSTTFAVSTNGSDWLSLGSGVRVLNGWQVEESSLPPNSTVYARGLLTCGYYNGSSGSVESSLGPPAISVQPADRTNNASSLASFTVIAQGTEPLSYQWCKNGAPLQNGGQHSGVLTATLVVSNVLGANAGGYSVILTNALGSVTSRVARLEVIDPYLSLQPLNQITNAGAVVGFAVTATGTAPLLYQWYKDNHALQNGGNTTGALSSNLRLNNVLGADNGTYSCLVSNGVGVAGSSVATLRVIDPFIRTQPTNQYVNPGQAATFSVTASGTAPMNYQWRRNGIDLPARTSSSLTLTNVQREDIAGYDVILDNAFGRTNSIAANLVVNLAQLDALNIAADGAVFCLAVQPDGGIVLGGTFNFVGGAPRTNIARLGPDGTLDPVFNPTVNGPVYAVALQQDNKIVLGGSFSSVGGEPHTNLCRLNPDGSLDPVFKGTTGGWVSSLVIQPDGKIVVGGGLYSLGGQPASGIGRLYPDGLRDTNFSTSIYPSVWTLALQPDGKILVGGMLTRVNNQARQYLARLNPDGSLDPDFSSSAGSFVYCLVVQPDNKIIVGGQFTTLGGQTCNAIGRLNAGGSLENAFAPGADNYVKSVALQADGRIVVGGWFMNFGGQPRARIGRLNADGTLDNSFNPGSGSEASAVTLQPDGSILVGGTFTIFAGQERGHFARLRNTDPATQILGYDGSTVSWTRAGTAPESWRTVFQATTNNADWWDLGAPLRVPGGWRLAGIQLPASATIRARGFVTGGASQTSTWFVDDRLVLSHVHPLIITGDGFFGFQTNAFLFNYRALPGQTIIIEASPDLMNWSSLTTNMAATSLEQFIDPDPMRPARFYRLRLGP